MIKHIINFIMVHWVYIEFFLLEGYKMILFLLNYVHCINSTIIFCILYLILKKCFEIYNIFVKLSLHLHCLVHIGLLMLILHRCFILLHNIPLTVPSTLNFSLTAIMLFLFSFSLYLLEIFVHSFIFNFFC